MYIIRYLWENMYIDTWHVPSELQDNNPRCHVKSWNKPRWTPARYHYILSSQPSNDRETLLVHVANDYLYMKTLRSIISHCIHSSSSKSQLAAELQRVIRQLSEDCITSMIRLASSDVLEILCLRAISCRFIHRTQREGIEILSLWYSSCG